jgi:PPK2 family polyphosphate:nucleotide phosphotransferase
MDYRRRLRVPPGSRVSLGRLDPGDTGDVPDKARGEELLARGVERLARLQDRLYAENSWALLVIVQALDAAGKDGTIKHVMSGVNPQGCQVFSFKSPSAEELEHDFLWRSIRALPERGRIGIHNRSYYEEVIVTRVHPELLRLERIPHLRPGDDLWKKRFLEINRFEKYLVDNGTLVLKFFLHVSKEEQRKRLLKRLEEPDKHWKFQIRDMRERACWDAYQTAYAEVLRHTSTACAPWYVIPADHKWFTRLAVAEIISDTLKDLDLQYPKPPPELRREMKQCKAELEKS